MNLLKVTHYLSNPRGLFLFFLVMGAVVFANGLNHPFMIDDHAFFDEAGRDPKNLWINFIPDKSKVLNMEGSPTEVYYRPFALIIPKLMYWLLHGNAFGMHLFNLLAFVCAVWLLARWLGRLSGDRWFGILAGVFVLVHPLNGIIVNFKTAGIFVGRVVCLIYAADFIIRGPRLVYQLYAVALFLAALFFHESAFILPPCVLCLSVLIQKKTWKEALRQGAPLWITAILYFLLRLQWASLSENIFNKFGGYHMSLSEALASWFSLQAWYLSKLIIPTGISIFILKPVVYGYAGVWIIGGMAFWCLTICLLWKLFKNNPWVWIGVSWLFLGLMMMGVGSLFHGQELMIEPHWMVFSSIGFFIILAQSFIFLFSRFKLAAGICFAVVLAGWCTTAWSYNALWNDELRYSQFWLKQSPTFTPINMYMARAYFAKGQLDLAATYYKRALTGQRPDYLMYSNLGSIALLQGRFEEARMYLEKALVIEPKAKNAMNVLGVVYVKQGDLIQAEKYFRLSVAANPFDTTAQRNLDFFLRIKSSKRDASSERVILER